MSLNGNQSSKPSLGVNLAKKPVFNAFQKLTGYKPQGYAFK